MTVKRKSVLLLITIASSADTVTLGTGHDPLPEPIAQYTNNVSLYRVPEGVSVTVTPDTGNSVIVRAGFVNSQDNVLFAGGTEEDFTFSAYGESMTIYFYEK